MFFFTGAEMKVDYGYSNGGRINKLPKIISIIEKVIKRARMSPRSLRSGGRPSVKVGSALWPCESSTGSL
jgi:hypothetical protein